MTASLRIALNAQFLPGKVGGVETAVTQLISALGRLSAAEGGEEEYLIVGLEDSYDWLRPILFGNQQVIPGVKSASTRARGPAEKFKQALGPLRPGLRHVRTILQPSRRAAVRQAAIPGGSDFFDGLDCDVIHFPYQEFFPGRRPRIYNPHDLQHRHFPQFFSAEELSRRERIYRGGCHSSHTVVAGSRWVADDIKAQYRVPEKRLQVIEWAAPVYDSIDLTEGKLREVRRRYELTRPFALYPAATWQHKNHLRLLEAVKKLRSRGVLDLDLVCTGEKTPYYSEIQARNKSLGLEEAVRFLGRIPGADLRALYRTARFVFIPTLFEAASGPLFEAWRENVPAACSAVTSLPEQAQGAALLFDPLSAEAIAGALLRMQSDDDLREDLLAAGRKRLEHFTWDRTARAYRAVYRRAAGRTLSDEEQDLLKSMGGANASSH